MGYYSESLAEKAFRGSGPIFHLYTKPLESDLFFSGNEDRIVAVNYLAIAIKMSKCKLLAYAIMTNHFHFIVEGTEADVLAFYGNFRKMMDTYFQRHERGSLMKEAEPGLTKINNIWHLRNEIAYVLRNPFVVMSDVNVFAYPWTSGNLYFNPLLEQKGVPASSLSVRKLRELTKTRVLPPIDETIYFHESVAQSWSFVDYHRAETFYDNARQFIFSVLKNVEGQTETALRYGETPSFCDEELIPHVYRMCKENFKADSPGVLDINSKKKLAVMVKNTFYSSNKQLSRLIKLPLADVNTLFPLSAK